MADHGLPAVARALLDWCGLVIPEYRLALLEGEIARLRETTDTSALAARLAQGDAKLRAALYHAASIPETFLFRHSTHFEALRHLAVARRGAGRGCHVLSAGASTGEEAWSAAAVLASVYGPKSESCSVTAWELDELRLQRGERGRFSAAATRAGFYAYERFFHREGTAFVVDDALRSLLRWRQVNLIAAAREPGDLFDAIFFRNVSIYWTAEQTAKVTAKLCFALAADGLLLFGPSDPVALDRKAFCRDGRYEHPVYVRTDSPNAPAQPPVTARAAPRHPVRPAASPLAERRKPAPSPLSPTRRRTAATAAGSSLEPKTPQAQAVSSPSPRDAAPPPRVRPPAPYCDVGSLVEHVQRLADVGKYSEALRLLEAGAGASASSAEVLLWKGILLLNVAEVREATRVLQQCVFLDGNDPVYRRWLAVGLEQLGRDAEAARERRNARSLEESA